MTNKLVVFSACVFALLGQAHAFDADETRELANLLKKVAHDIKTLKPQYPQLMHFERSQHLHASTLTIEYGYKTHRSKRRGGWVAAVPNPDADGVWFYIDIHEVNSQRQIHTQPVTPGYCYKNKRVSFLILEGKKTKSVRPAISRILNSHHIRNC